MIRTIKQTIELNDGQVMPGYGFGLYKAIGEELTKAVNVAWSCAYRLFDTAAYYNNEETTGAALNGYPADKYFLISKIWPTDYDHPVRALDKSLKNLRRDYLNGYLLHWPGHNEKTMLTVWEKLLREQEKSKIITLGCSNFLEQHLQAIADNFGKYPAINQIEVHPYFQETALCDFCAQQGIAVMAWSPLGRGNELDNAVLANIAADTGKSVAQVILRWHIQQNRIPIPKSVHAERIKANADVFDFELTAAQMRQIADLELPDNAGRRGPDPLVFP